MSVPLALDPLGLDIEGPISDGLSAVASFVPKFVAFLVILAIGWLLAAVLKRAVRAVLHRVGFERLAERGGLKKPLARSQWDPTELVAKLVYYAVLLVALTMAFGVFGPNPVSDLLHALIAFLPRLVVAIVIVVLAAAIAAGARDLIGGALGGVSYGRLIANVAAGFVIALGVIAALNQVGIATTVTGPVLIAVLATVGGILVVGVGGGLVRPMQQRWERMLNAAEEESRSLRQQGPGADGHQQPSSARMRDDYAMSTSGARHSAMSGTGSGPGGSMPGSLGSMSGPTSGTMPATGAGPAGGPMPRPTAGPSYGVTPGSAER